jgi:hypothetical protein
VRREEMRRPTVITVKLRRRWNPANRKTDHPEMLALLQKPDLEIMNPRHMHLLIASLWFN